MVPGTFRAWAICASLSLPGAIVAQLSRTGQMAGWTILSPSAPGEVQLQDVKNGCLTAKTLCQGVLKASQFPGGGTAYDPRHSAFWLSDGVTVEFRDRS